MAIQEFYLHDSERWCMWILCILGVVVNVVPKYLGNDLAKRHIVAPKVNRILLVHIVSGICTVLGNGLVGILGGFSGVQLNRSWNLM